MALYVVGIAVSIVAIAFVVREFLRTDILQTVEWTEPTSWWALIGGSVTYAAISLLIAAGWSLQVCALDPGTRLPRALVVHACVQILKYLPLNILHQPGRAALLKTTGTPLRATILASFGEAGLVVAACVLCALIFGIDAGVLRPSALPPLAPIGGGVLIAAVGTAAWIWRSAVGRWFREFGTRWLVAATLALTAYVAFFVLYGLLVHWVAAALAPDISVGKASLVVGGLSAAWVVGFITPGAAAGLGVREAALVLLLSPSIGREAALLIAIASRAVNVAGDALFALLGAALIGAVSGDRSVREP